MLRLQEMRGIVGAQMGGRGSIMNIEKLTTSLQFIGAALALPAGAAGVYSAYHTYFSPEVMCQEMRNATLITLEKNIPVEAKRTLLRKEASQFEASDVAEKINLTAAKTDLSSTNSELDALAVRAFLFPSQPVSTQVTAKAVGRRLKAHIGEPVKRGAETLMLKTSMDTHGKVQKFFVTII